MLSRALSVNGAVSSHATGSRLGPAVAAALGAVPRTCLQQHRGGASLTKQAALVESLKASLQQQLKAAQLKGWTNEQVASSFELGSFGSIGATTSKSITRHSLEVMNMVNELSVDVEELFLQLLTCCLVRGGAQTRAGECNRLFWGFECCERQKNRPLTPG